MAIALASTGTGAGMAWGLALAIVAAIVSSASCWALPWWIARWLRHHADCSATAAWDDTGFSTSGCQHHGPSQVEWARVLRAIETDHYLILQARRLAYFLPKEALAADAIEDLRARLAQRRIKLVIDSRSA